MLAVVALSVSVREEKKYEKCSQNSCHESNNTMVRCILHAGETNLLWAMAVWFWKYYDCLNITYDSYSPNAQPLIKRFKMVGEMKTRELALDVLVADIWGGNVKVYIWKIEDINLMTGDCQRFHLKRSVWARAPQMSGSVFSPGIRNDFHLHVFKSTGCDAVLTWTTWTF